MSRLMLLPAAVGSSPAAPSEGAAVVVVRFAVAALDGLAVSPGATTLALRPRRRVVLVEVAGLASVVVAAAPSALGGLAVLEGEGCF
jgi:hypothetical protein